MDRETVDEIKRHFDVVAERLESKIEAVADGVALTCERIERLESSINERFDRLEQRMGGLDARMDRLESEVHEGFTELRSMIKLS
jgi:hypothetical protein